MSAALLNISVEQGATFAQVLKFADASGTPINLTGSSFRGQIRKTPSDSVVKASFVFDITDAEGGEVRMSLPSEALVGQVFPGTNAQALTKWVYDVEMTDSLLQVTRILNGTVSISPEVTR